MNKQVEEEANRQISARSKEILALLLQLLPNTAPILSIFILSSVNVYFIELTNDNNLVASLGLSVSLVNSLQYSAQIALQCGLITLAGQAYGNQNYKQMGLYFQRSLFISLIYTLIAYLFLSKAAAPLLIACGINEQIAQHVQQFCRWSLLSFLFSAAITNISSILYSKQIFQIPMYSQLAAYLLHPFWCFFFIQSMGFQSLKGVALARSCSDLCTLLILLFFIYRQSLFQGMKCKSIHPQAFQRWN
jgi:MATE family multidrug resistance protein